MFKVQFDFEGINKPLFYSNLPVFSKNEYIGKATSIVWSPKYSKYIGFLIVDKNIEQNINDYTIMDKIGFDVVKVI